MRKDLEMDRKMNYSYNNMMIELFDDPTYTIGADNRNAYASMF